MYDIIVDIDGTVANGNHRQPLIQNKPKDWGRYKSLSRADTPHSDIIYIVQALYQTGCKIIFCSGRSEEERTVTSEWLHDYTGFLIVEPSYWESNSFVPLYMRAYQDYRPDDEIKLELLAEIRKAGYDPKIVFDDRNRVVDMWRREGLRCLQVQPGAF